MDIHELPDDLDLLASPDRSRGLHLSEVLASIGGRMGFWPKGKGNEKVLRFELGFLWEGLLSNALRERRSRIDHPGEIELDGVIGSPDGFSWDEGELVLEEYKATWKKMRRMEELADEWYWMAQMQGYCKMLGIRKAILRVLWINGDYSPPAPVYRSYGIEFTQEEIEANWRMVRREADLMKAE